MNRFDFSRYVSSACVAAAMLAGCGVLRQAQDDMQPPIGAVGARPQTSAIATHTDRGKSWMLPQAKNIDLLYVADPGSEEVVAFSYPGGDVVGALTGITAPAGECTSKRSNGDWWVVAYNEVLEYAHGGMSPIATLSVSGPADCAVDPKTGNLAVTVLTSGNVVIFDQAKGSGKTYPDGLQDSYNDGYDAKGDLFVDGFNSASEVRLVELPKGGSSFEPITLDQSLGLPGSVQWNQKYLAILNPGAGAIYQFAIGGKKGKRVGTTPLNSVGDPAAFWIANGEVAVADIGKEDVGIWDYPAGGSPITVITSYMDFPSGVTVSTVRICKHRAVEQACRDRGK